MKRGGGVVPRTGSVRCAIYTRKSSDEGLEQDFNSLDAQREACAAYILSQASEGWYEIGSRYDDGGISGGTLERPALQRLLADVAAGQIDIIVVYKVDRLTRSLLDFAKLVETFDKAEASFVSITQAFNTTTSMGRLTLNMLLSFAQFEREVTAERIRDKIAASKAKGMWMGGTPPLGYRPDGRSLAIVDEHAGIIREVFRRYLELGNVRLVTDSLARDRIHAPVRTRIGSGKPYGGVPFSRGQVHAFLKCAAYVGEIHHQRKIYAALHPPIIDRATWDAVQAKLAEHVQGERRAPRAATTSLLAGRIVDADGEPLLATHAVKPVLSGVEGGKVRYRYFVSRALHHKESATGLRIPAREIETLVANRVAALFDDPVALIATAWLEVPPERYPELINRCAELAAQQRQRSRNALQLIDEVRVAEDGITVTCATAAIADALSVSCHPDAPAAITLSHTARLTRTGRAMRLVQDDGAAPAANLDASLVTFITRARSWWATLREGELDITRLTAREGVSASYMSRVLRLAFLSPKVVDAVLAGRQRAEVDVKMLTLESPPAASWRAQEVALLPA